MLSYAVSPSAENGQNYCTRMRDEVRQIRAAPLSIHRTHRQVGRRGDQTFRQSPETETDACCQMHGNGITGHLKGDRVALAVGSILRP